jgi:hypothetical protein
MRLGVALAGSHVVVDQRSHGVVPGGNLFMSMLAVFVPFLDEVVLVFEGQVVLLGTAGRPAAPIELLFRPTFATSTTFRLADARLADARFPSTRLPSTRLPSTRFPRTRLPRSFRDFFAIAAASATSPTTAAASSFTLLRFPFPLTGFDIQLSVQLLFDFLEGLDLPFLGEFPVFGERRLDARLAARTRRWGSLIAALAATAASTTAATPTTRFVLLFRFGHFLGSRLFDLFAECHGWLFFVDLVIERSEFGVQIELHIAAARAGTDRLLVALAPRRTRLPLSPRFGPARFHPGSFRTRAFHAGRTSFRDRLLGDGFRFGLRFRFGRGWQTEHARQLRPVARGALRFRFGRLRRAFGGRHGRRIAAARRRHGRHGGRTLDSRWWRGLGTLRRLGRVRGLLDRWLRGRLDRCGSLQPNGFQQRVPVIGLLGFRHG